MDGFTRLSAKEKGLPQKELQRLLGTAAGKLRREEQSYQHDLLPMTWQ